MKNILLLLGFCLLLPTMTYAQEDGYTMYTPEEVARMTEMQKRYENGEMSQAELEAYALTNDGNEDLQEYLPEETPLTQAVDGAATNEVPTQQLEAVDASDSSKEFVDANIVLAQQSQIDKLYTLLFLLAGIVLISTLLTLYSLLRKR